jgi:periplasmic binding family protein
MKIRSAIYVLAFLTACLTPCFAHHTAVVVNKDNAVENVTSAHLAKIIRGEVKKWPDGKNIVLVLHKDSAGEAETLERLNKMSDAEWKSFLALHKIRFCLLRPTPPSSKQCRPNPEPLASSKSIRSTTASMW